MEVKKHYNLRIELLTGLHIGNGNALSRTDYFVDRDRIKVVDMNRLFPLLEKDPQMKGEFSMACSAARPSALQSFLSSAAGKNPALVSYEIPCTPELKTTIRKDDAASGFLINQFYRVPIGGKLTPLVPGSSVKGALRTVILNAMMKDSPDISLGQWKEWVKKRDDFFPNDSKELAKLGTDYSKKLLSGSAESHGFAVKDSSKNDVLRFLEITDCRFADEPAPFLAGRMKVAGNTGMIQESIDLAAEVAKGKALGCRSSADGTLTLDLGMSELFDSPINRCVSDGLEGAGAVEKIARWANALALRELENERKNFPSLLLHRFSAFQQVLSNANRMKDATDSFLLRIGRWSQCEYVTFSDRWRAPKTRSRVDDRQFSSTEIADDKKWKSKSRTLFSDQDDALVPLGWCLCTITDKA